MPVLNEYVIIGCVFLLPPQEDDVNLPHDEIPLKPSKTVNLTNMDIPILP